MHPYNQPVRVLAKDVVLEFTHLVKERIHQGDESYLKSGVDKDINVYTDFFKYVTSKLFGTKYTPANNFPAKMVTDAYDALVVVVANHKYGHLLKNRVLADCTFLVCVSVSEIVRNDLFLTSK